MKYKLGGYHERGKLIHGYECRKHPLYSKWHNMLRRCYNKEEPHYHNYGGRGITVCDEWRTSFERFALDMGIPKKGLTLDRINNELGYSKNNCKWSTGTEQCLNRRQFKNNTTGHIGVVKVKNGSYTARYDEGLERYTLGRFESAEEASQYRDKFIETLRSDRKAAMSMLERRARLDSSTGIRGITANEDGFLVRVTVNKVRVYVGFSKTFEGAVDLLNNYKETGNVQRKYNK